MSVQMMMASLAVAAMTAAIPASGVAAKVAAPVDKAASAAVAKPTSAKTKYCVMTSGTGSRMERKVCRTRADWLAEGFDPHAEK